MELRTRLISFEYESAGLLGRLAYLLSHAVFGFWDFVAGRTLKGALYLVAQLGIIVFFALVGVQNLIGLSLNGIPQQSIEDPVTGIIYFLAGDNSMLMLLNGVLAVFMLLLFLLVGVSSALSGRKAVKLYRRGSAPCGFKQQAKDLLSPLINEELHITLLLVPFLGLFVFTVAPLVFMILIAFTNFDREHLHPKLFNWVGFQNFATLLSPNTQFGSTFFRVAGWTFVWAFFATFTCYFGGIFLAMLINQKNIKGKTLFRTIFILTIAIPSFITLSSVSKMLDGNGIVNILLVRWGFAEKAVQFFNDPTLSRITVIFVNMWIGIPFTLLFATGVLQSLPAELIESAKIDGANGVQRFSKIVMPYVLFITSPVLVTNFIGNINNFNVIFFLTGGRPTVVENFGGAGATDLLVTWLFRLTADSRDYSYASVIGNVVFIICAVISVVFLRRTKSFKNEGEYR